MLIRHFIFIYFLVISATIIKVSSMHFLASLCWIVQRENKIKLTSNHKDGICRGLGVGSWSQITPLPPLWPFNWQLFYQWAYRSEIVSTFLTIFVIGGQNRYKSIKHRVFIIETYFLLQARYLDTENSVENFYELHDLECAERLVQFRLSPTLTFLFLGWLQFLESSPRQSLGDPSKLN